MTVRVAIRGRAETLVVPYGETVLAAALKAGVPYPHGCRSGNCGACKSELLSGEVELAPYSKYALSDAERASGLVLACRATAWEDISIGWLAAEDAAVHPERHLDCRVDSVAAATHDIRRVRLAVVAGGPFDFSAGQYAAVTFVGLPPRDYSMANRPDEDGLEFHIRLVPGGAVTPYVANDLAPGATVRVSGPYGTSHWRRRHRGPILALAGGSGFAPIRAILTTALAAGAAQPIRLYFGVRAERDLYALDELEALAARHRNFSYVPVLSEPGGPTARRTGFLHDAVAADYPAAAALDGFKAYLAGPPPMVEAATALLAARGLRRQDCHADAFYSEADKAALTKGSVP
jgi:CDP-4-dehydro-6-deoxyglucose reductase/ferredoxin-NAD(P)+ reductase (naphthalene dioxygenase ferredoxin-specific)